MYLIYCIGVKGSWFSKVGYTKNEKTLKLRIRTLQCGNPKPLRVKWVFKSRTLDHVIHRHLFRFGVKKTRDKGEWFRIGGDRLQKLISQVRPAAQFYHWNGKELT